MPSSMDFRFARALTAVTLGAAFLGACSRSAARPDEQAPTDVARRVQIAECGPSQETCLVVTGAPPVSNRVNLAAGSTFGGSAANWLLAAHTGSLRARVLVLFDVSGSMKGQGMASVRAGVASFLASLPPDRVSVAVAPFESHDVLAHIRAAKLGTPAAAARSLDALPEPGGNTGLYTAVREGALLLGASSIGDAHLVVVTDGVNDVHPGDDAGLLDGPSGLLAAVNAAAQSSVHVWTIGVGATPDRRELVSLAGSDDHAQIVADDPVELSRALHRVSDRIVANNLLVVGTTAAPAIALGAWPRDLRVVIRDQGATRVVGGKWTPPLLAPPVPSRQFTQHGTVIGPETEVGITWWRWALLFMPLAFVVLATVPASLAMDTADGEESLAQTVPSTEAVVQRPVRVRSPVDMSDPRAEPLSPLTPV